MIIYKSNKFLFSPFLILALLIFFPVLLASPAGDNIIISEVEYNPATPPPPNTSFDVENEGEWFELYNPTSLVIDIGGWTIQEGGGPTYTFPSPTVIAAGDYLLVTNRTDRFNLNYPTITPDLQMDPLGAGLLRLNNGGDQLTLTDTTTAPSTIVDFVAWNNNVAGWTANAVDGPICRIGNVDTDAPSDWSDCSTSPTPGSVGPGFILSKASVTLNEGNTDTFTIVLTAQPATNVVVDISSSDLTAASLSPSSLTFTNANWATPQTITITAVSDADQINENVTLTATINDAASDNIFDSLIDQTVAVSVNEVVVSPIPTLSEWMLGLLSLLLLITGIRQSEYKLKIR